jgi:hypothetical protein
MRKIDWSNPLVIAALIGAGAAIGVAVIEGIPKLVELLQPEPMVIAASPTSGFLGRGSAELKVPQALPESGEGIVSLRIYLREELDPEHIDFTHGDISPPEVAEQPGTDINPPTRSRNYKERCSAPQILDTWLSEV